MKYRAGGRTIDKNHKLECYENPVVKAVKLSKKSSAKS